MEGYDLDYALLGRWASWALTALAGAFGTYGVAALVRAWVRFRTAMSDIARDILGALEGGQAVLAERNVERQEAAALKIDRLDAQVRFGPTGEVTAYQVGRPVVNVRPLLGRRERKRLDKAAQAYLKRAVLRKAVAPF